jgi:type II secretory pathway pseudopilin PulG
MKSNFKRSFSLLELILVLFISSIVLIYTFMFTKELYESQISNENTQILKLDINSAKIIIERNLPNSKNSLKYLNKTLYLDNNVLLKNVTSFSKKVLANTMQIDIVIDDKIKQKWEYKW